MNKDYMIPKKYQSSKVSNIRISKLRNLLTRVLISIIIVLGVSIFIKLDSKNLLYVEKYVFEDSLEFTTINNLYQKYIGKIIPDTDSNDTEMVFSSSNLSANNYIEYENGYMINISKGRPVNLLIGGIVVFVGEKDDYGYTVIVQGNDGVDYWYGNITNVSISLYDYLETGTLIGEANDDFIYLVFQKNNEYLNYEDVI